MASGELTPSDRSLIGRIAINKRWWNTPPAERTKVTAPGRAAFEARFAKQVDPNNELEPDERAKLIANARAEYFSRLALQASKARRAKAAERRRRAPRRDDADPESEPDQ